VRGNHDGRPPRPPKPLSAAHVEALAPYPAGKPIEELERELGVSNVIKLASNENAFGPSPRALEAGARALAGVHRYPDGNAYYLREALAATYDTPFDGVVTGNGSNDLIEIIVKAFVGGDEEVLIARGSFVMYELALQGHGVKRVEVPMRELRYDLEAMAAHLNERTKAVFIANPDNPTGTYVTRAELDAFAARVPPDCILVLDEAYYEFATAPDYPSGLEYRDRVERLIILRTFSKAYGLAGLRVGFALTTPDIARNMHRVRQPFNVNLVAQAAAVAALGDHEHVARTRAGTSAGLAFLYRELERIGLRYVPSQTNFVLVDCAGDGARVYQDLLRRGVIVRPMQAYGLPSYVRVTVGTESENRRFIDTLAAVMDGPASLAVRA
jgi:histidinol-phosphate aminotransferase